MHVNDVWNKPAPKCTYCGASGPYQCPCTEDDPDDESLCTACDFGDHYDCAGGFCECECPVSSEDAER